MRGLYSAALLDTLSERFEQTRSLNNLDIGKGFDLIVGTSTGGILASGLAFGLSIKDIIKMYSEKGPLIFCDPMPEVSKAFEFYRWCLRNRKSQQTKMMY